MFSSLYHTPSCQSHTSSHHHHHSRRTHTRTPELCYAADENAMEEKAGFTTSDHKKKMTSDPLHGEVPRRSHLLFASTSLRRKKTDVAFRFSIRFSISESSVRPVSPPHLCARPNGPVGQDGFRTIKFQSFPPFFAGLRDRQMELDGLFVRPAELLKAGRRTSRGGVGCLAAGPWRPGADPR